MAEFDNHDLDPRTTDNSNNLVFMKRQVISCMDTMLWTVLMKLVDLTAKCVVYTIACHADY